VNNNGQQPHGPCVQPLLLITTGTARA